MTKKELYRLIDLNREIQEEKKRLDTLRRAATSTSAQISGLPHLSGISDKTAIAASIADSVTIIESKNREAIAEYNRLTRYIASIDDSFIRQAIRMKFIDGQSWTKVAMTIGGNNTADGVRMAVDRYLNRH